MLLNAGAGEAREVHSVFITMHNAGFLSFATRQVVSLFHFQLKKH